MSDGKLKPGMESWCEGHPESPDPRWPGGYSRPIGGTETEPKKRAVIDRFRWFSQPENGSDVFDAKLVTDAMLALDSVSSFHRTDAFRLLAARYREDLERMKREDEKTP